MNVLYFSRYQIVYFLLILQQLDKGKINWKKKEISFLSLSALMIKFLQYSKCHIYTSTLQRKSSVYDRKEKALIIFQINLFEYSVATVTFGMKIKCKKNQSPEFKGLKLTFPYSSRILNKISYFNYEVEKLRKYVLLRD